MLSYTPLPSISHLHLHPQALWWLSMNTPPEVRSEPRLAHEFHADTAVGVLRQTRYFHHALFVASAVERHDLVLQILVRVTMIWMGCWMEVDG